MLDYNEDTPCGFISPIDWSNISVSLGIINFSLVLIYLNWLFFVYLLVVKTGRNKITSYPKAWTRRFVQREHRSSNLLLLFVRNGFILLLFVIDVHRTGFAKRSSPSLRRLLYMSIAQSHTAAKHDGITSLLRISSTTPPQLRNLRSVFNL